MFIYHAFLNYCAQIRIWNVEQEIQSYYICYFDLAITIT